MPYAKRIVIHGKHGLGNCINYVKNDEKTFWLESGLNCSPVFAYEQMRTIQKKFHISADSDSRTGYHIIQSFREDDPVSPEQVHEMGRKLCQTIYPEYQCLICTHQDKFHLHNHIVVNVCDLHGKKLEDRLANRTEGIYGLLKASEELGKQYGCRTMDEEIVSLAKAKNYSGSIFYERQVPHRTRLEGLLRTLKEECWSVEELIRKVSEAGWKISRNTRGCIQYLGPEGKRSIPETNLPEELRSERLAQYFRCKDSSDIKDAKLLFDEPIKPDTPITEEIFREVQRSQRILEIMHDQNEEIQKRKAEIPSTFRLEDFRPLRYREISRRNRLVQMQCFCMENGIQTREGLAARVIHRHVELSSREIELASAVVEYQNLEKSGASKTVIARAKRHCNWLYYRTTFLRQQTDILDSLQLQEEMNSDAMEIITCPLSPEMQKAVGIDQKQEWQISGCLYLSKASAYKTGKGKHDYSSAHEVKDLLSNEEIDHIEV